MIMKTITTTMTTMTVTAMTTAIATPAAATAAAEQAQKQRQRTVGRWSAVFLPESAEIFRVGKNSKCTCVKDKREI